MQPKFFDACIVTNDSFITCYVSSRILDNLGLGSYLILTVIYEIIIILRKSWGLNSNPILSIYISQKPVSNTHAFNIVLKHTDLLEQRGYFQRKR